MSYQLPSPYKCVKCGHEFEYSPHQPHPAPVLSREVQTERHGIHNQHMPVCPKCWCDFLLKNIGIGYNTEKWKPEGSDYDIAKSSKGEA